MKTEKQILQNNQVAEVILSYSQKIKAENRITVNNPQMVVEVFRSVWDDSKIELQESFKLMLLNTRLQVLGIVDSFEGGITATIVDLRIIFVAALKAAATVIIVAHSHPSGSLIFSKSDLELTEKIIKAGKLLEIQVNDHIILTKDSYASYYEEFGINPIPHYKNKK
jgi:DNA repair protein RadC